MPAQQEAHPLTSHVTKHVDPAVNWHGSTAKPGRNRRSPTTATGTSPGTTAGAVVAVLVSLSVILTASVLFPGITSRQIIDIMAGCGAAMVLAAGYALARGLRAGARAGLRVVSPSAAGLPAAGLPAAGLPSAGPPTAELPATEPSAGLTDREGWRMPPLATLRRPAMSTGRKIGMSALRLYLAVAMILVIVRIVQLAIGH
jgi:hypothetical protein